MGEAVRARPDDAERAQAGAVVHLEEIELGVDRFRALEMELHRKHAIDEALAELARGANDFRLTVCSRLTSGRANRRISHR